jgi:hypothetical protein
MSNGSAIVKGLKKGFKNWEFSSIDSFGLFGGLVIGWNHILFLMNCFVIISGLCTKLYSKILAQSFTILNVYGPYEDKHHFWDKIFNLQVMDEG